MRTLPRRRPAGAVEVRAARSDEAGTVAELLSRAAFGPTVGRLIVLPRASPHGDILVADGGRAPVGAVCTLSFGATGWIGALGVEPRRRGHGIGTALTEAAVAQLRERGARTVLLFATDLGRPVYERLGFVAEGAVMAWRGRAGVAPAALEVRRLCEDDRPAVAALDAEATGEERARFLDHLRPLHGLGAERAGALCGWSAGSPYGAGAAVCAADAEAGVALLAAVAGGPQPSTVVVPAANAAAARALADWGFNPANAGERMRLGPAVAWRPERQFALFNLFWG
jgi:GNAT superfamily N-acetyltransferase